MKKFFILVSIMLTAVCAQAQLKIHENGNISINTTENPISTLSIGYTGNESYTTSIAGNNSAIYGRRTGIPTTTTEHDPWTYGVTGLNSPNDNKFYVGVRGSALVHNDDFPNKGRAFGVYGVAGNTTSGYNYGVYGQLNGTKNGAAIFGTLNPNDACVPGRYAGYFAGDVKVTGTLYAPYLTTVAASSSNTRTLTTLNTNTTDGTVSEKFSQLSAIQFSINPQTAKTSRLSEGDTLDTQSYTDTEIQAMEKSHYGLVATQLQQVYPDLVYENQQGDLCINYIEMIPLLVQSIKELKAEIVTLQGGKNVGTVVNTRAAYNTTDIEESTALTIPILKQNNPNPFTENTVIEYSLPESVQTANIYIYDMNGKQIEQIYLTERGESSITINGENLSAGMYLYSLIADGQVIDTKRMILTK
ncbi:MAG: T9SS type A sorting domain-containing protein [Bacteroidaceae bacterium]|nr:T9SS type A sorting domain-containing protein [Bacteroidaceae bacterium]